MPGPLTQNADPYRPLTPLKREEPDIEHRPAISDEVEGGKVVREGGAELLLRSPDVCGSRRGSQRA
jgi:hypothetical protein